MLDRHNDTEHLSLLTPEPTPVIATSRTTPATTGAPPSLGAVDITAGGPPRSRARRTPGGPTTGVSSSQKQHAEGETGTPQNSTPTGRASPI